MDREYYEQRQERLAKAKHFLKQLIEPQVLSILKQFRNEAYSEDGNIAVIVVGGAATDMWLNSSDEKTLTKDFDLRLVYKTIFYDEEWYLDDEDDLAIKYASEQLQNVLAFHLNRYIYNIAGYIRAKLAKGFGVIPIFHDNQLFLINETGNLRTIEWDYEIDNVLMTDSVVDIFPITNEVEEQYWQMSAFREDENLFDLDSDFPIPMVNYYGVNYVGLGYAIWDLQHLIENEIKGPEQVAKNEAKLKTLLRVLNNPKNNLNYKMLSNTLNTCLPKVDSICKSNGYDVDIGQVMNYAINQGYFPPESEELYKVVNTMGRAYICDYIDRSKSQ